MVVSAYILQEFSKLDVKMTSSAVKALRIMILKFEMRGDHPLVLNTQALGTKRVVFTTGDRKEFFDIFGTTERDVDLAIQKTPSIVKTRKVASDAFNLFCVWVMHLGHISTSLTREEKEMVVFDACKVLNYKFFTALCNNTFFKKYLANEQAMLAAVSELNRKFSLTEYGTWRGVIEKRVQNTIAPTGKHYQTIELMDNDDKILYVVTDTRTHVADRIKNVYDVYKDILDSGSVIGSYTSTKEVEGEKVIRDQVSLLDSMIANLAREVLNPDSFYDRRLCIAVSGMFKAIREETLKDAIIEFATTAHEQAKIDGALDEVKSVGGKKVYVGIRILITSLIQNLYHRMLVEEVPRNTYSILYYTKNTFQASRMSDKDLLMIKDSIEYFLTTINTVNREATRASLRLAIIVYIITKTFIYL